MQFHTENTFVKVRMDSNFLEKTYIIPHLKIFVLNLKTQPVPMYLKAFYKTLFFVIMYFFKDK